MAFDSDRTPRAILDELGKHPKQAQLVELVHTLAMSAFDERRRELGEGLDEAASRVGVDEASAQTSFGNVLSAINKRAAASGPERTLLGALVARGVASVPPADEDAQRRVAEGLAWIAGHTIADPLCSLEPALGGSPSLVGLFNQLANLVRAHDRGDAGSIDRSSAIVSALAIGRGTSDAASAARVALREALQDPTLVLLVAPAAEPAPGTADLVITGEEATPPRNLAFTVFLACSLILPILAVARLFGRFALRVRRPAELAFTKDGVMVRSRMELLGKTVRERETFMSTTNLVRAAREVRYPRLATYVGIVCLLIGSYIGLRYFFDGLRSGSPEFLGFGLVILVGAIVVDYVLSHLPAASPDRCRIVLVPRRGRTVAFARVDRVKAEAALARLRAS